MKMSVRELIDEIDAMADEVDHFDDSFVRSVEAQFNRQGHITPKQELALNNIYNMLYDQLDNRW